VQDLIAQVDDRLVMTADPYREDLIVTVWRGVEVGVFADDASEDEDDEGDEYDEDYDDDDDDLDDED